MFDWILPEKHAISILKKDHETVKKLFDNFEKAKGRAEKEKIITQAVTELKIHAILEEEIFYPTVRKYVGSEIMNEADEEHHVARVLIAELDHNGVDHDHRNAKFTVLAENIRHHIKEEEGEMLPKTKDLEIDFEALGQKMLDRKQRLKKQGIPDDQEHVMVAKTGGKADTPAATASRTSATSHKSRTGTSRKKGTRVASGKTRGSGAKASRKKTKS